MASPAIVFFLPTTMFTFVHVPFATPNEDLPPAAPPQERSPKQCRRCGKILPNRARRVSHEKSHRKKLISCSVPDCFSAFTRRSSARIHLVHVHGIAADGPDIDKWVDRCRKRHKG